MRKKLNLTSILLPILLGVLILCIIAQFFFGVTQDRTQIAYDVLSETTSQHVETINDNINSKDVFLKAVASQYSIFDLQADKAKITSLLNTMADKCAFNAFGVIFNPSGDYYCSDNVTSLDDLRASQMWQYAQSNLSYMYLARTSLTKSPSFIVQSAPIRDADGKMVGVLFGLTNQTDFYNLLSPTIYKEKANHVLVFSNGDYVTKGQGTDYGDSTNLYQFLLGNSNVTQAELDVISSDVLNGKSGTFEFTTNGVRRYVLYTPFGFNNWTYFISLTAKTVEQTNSGVMNRAIVLSAELSVTFLAVIIYVAISEKKKYNLLAHEKEELHQMQEMYYLINDMSETILFYAEPNKDQIIFNNTYEKVFGRKPPFSKISDIGFIRNTIYDPDLPEYLAFSKDLKNGVPESSAEYRILDKDGIYVWYRLEYQSLYDENHVPYKLVGKMVNIDSQRRQIAELKQKAETDSLTLLLNRATIKQRIDEFLAGEGKESVHAFFYVDIDNFKMVNDEYGHNEGDNVLIKYASVMKRLFRNIDLMGRLGGDEFVILVKNLHFSAMIDTKARNLCASIAAVCLDTASQKYSSCSIGVALYDKDGVDFDQLYQKADVALHNAKNKGKNNFSVYSDDMPENLNAPEEK